MALRSANLPRTRDELIAMAFHLLRALDDEEQRLTYQAVTARYRPQMPGSDGNQYWQQARECYQP